MNIKEEINRLTAVYLEEEIDFQRLNQVSFEIRDFMESLTTENMDTEAGKEDIHCDNGRALGTYWAAACLDDLLRTRQFVRGIHKAIQNKHQNKETIHILYAGTGPFAILILPFIFRYSRQQIQYTLLEINPLTFKILTECFSKFGLHENTVRFEQQDATKYKITNDPPDIIISETMQNALTKEQQVPIFFNLMKQVPEQTLFIPEKIEIFLGLKNSDIASEWIKKEDYRKVKQVFELSKKTLPIKRKLALEEDAVPDFPALVTILEKDHLKGTNQLVLITEIQVYQDEWIEINESGLTTPFLIMNFDHNQKEGLKVHTQYLMSANPELTYKITLT